MKSIKSKTKLTLIGLTSVLLFTGCGNEEELQNKIKQQVVKIEKQNKIIENRDYEVSELYKERKECKTKLNNTINVTDKKIVKLNNTISNKDNTIKSLNNELSKLEPLKGLGENELKKRTLKRDTLIKDIDKLATTHKSNKKEFDLISNKLSTVKAKFKSLNTYGFKLNKKDMVSWYEDETINENLKKTFSHVENYTVDTKGIIKSVGHKKGKIQINLTEYDEYRIDLTTYSNANYSGCNIMLRSNTGETFGFKTKSFWSSGMKFTPVGKLTLNGGMGFVDNHKEILLSIRKRDNQLVNVYVDNKLFGIVKGSKKGFSLEALDIIGFPIKDIRIFNYID